MGNQAGDSIPKKVDEGLSSFDTFVILWSANAARSNWIRDELSSAITRRVRDRSASIIPCRLDDTERPPLIAHLKAIDFDDEAAGIEELLLALTGRQTRQQRLHAIQQALGDLDVSRVFHPAATPAFCCPACGSESIEPWQQSDERDRIYGGLRCRECSTGLSHEE